MSHRLGHRRGFALAAVLWVLTVASVVGAATALRGRSEYSAARNRTNAERAFWIAEGCVAAVRADVDGALAAATAATLPQVWRTLDTSAASAQPSMNSACRATLRSVGSAIDVNGATDPILRKYFLNGAGSAAADALTDGLLDWRDADDISGANGAERAWYFASQRPAPRNDSLAADEEILLVRGLESRPDLTDVLSVEPGRVCLTTAPAPVLAALPGFTAAAVNQVLADRANGVWFGDLNLFRARLPKAAADSILAHFSELTAATTVEPEGWILTVSARVGEPAVTATTELRIDRQVNRAAILRRRSR